MTSLLRNNCHMHACPSPPLQLVPQYEKQAKELEEQVQTFERLREMEGKVRELEMEMEWAMVIQIEKVSVQMM